MMKIFLATQQEIIFPLRVPQGSEGLFKIFYSFRDKCPGAKFCSSAQQKDKLGAAVKWESQNGHSASLALTHVLSWSAPQSTEIKWTINSSL